MREVKPLRFDPIAEAREQWVKRGWGNAADGMAVVTSVVRVQQILLGRIDTVLRPMGLSFARYEVLMLLMFSRAGALPLGKLGARLQVQPGAVTNVMDRLEADGLVVRQSHPSDGRTTLGSITEQGRRLAVDATIGLNDRVFQVAELRSPAGSALFSLLREIRVAHGDFAAGDESAVD